MQLVSFHASRGQLHEALLVAQVACEGGFPKQEIKQHEKPLDLRKNDLLPTLTNHVTDDSDKRSAAWALGLRITMFTATIAGVATVRNVFESSELWNQKKVRLSGT